MTTVSPANSIWNANAAWTPPATSSLADVFAGQKSQKKQNSFADQLAAQTNPQTGSAAPQAHAHHRHANHATNETPASQAQEL
jgi:hypothetical protein